MAVIWTPYVGPTGVGATVTVPQLRQLQITFEDEDSQDLVLSSNIVDSATGYVQVTTFADTCDCERTAAFSAFSVVGNGPALGTTPLFFARSAIVCDDDGHAAGFLEGDDDDGWQHVPNWHAVQPSWSIPRYALTGQTIDGTTATPIAGVTVEAYDTPTDAVHGLATSDGSGNYTIPVFRPGPYYLRAYLAGSPDKAGTTRNDVTADPA